MSPTISNCWLDYNISLFNFRQLIMSSVLWLTLNYTSERPVIIHKAASLGPKAHSSSYANLFCERMLNKCVWVIDDSIIVLILETGYDDLHPTSFSRKARRLMWIIPICAFAILTGCFYVHNPTYESKGLHWSVLRE